MFRSAHWVKSSRSRRSRTAVSRAAEFGIQKLEARCLLSTSVYQYHNNLSSNGQNLTESLLTPTTVNTNQFARQFSTPVDGQIFAQPLYVPNTSITSGNLQGTHNVVYVATEHDSLYAIDSNGGNVLWQRSFLDTSNSAVNLLGAASITSVPSADIISTDLTPEVGITSTPVIDPATNKIYVLAKTKQAVSSGGTLATNYVQTLFAVSTQSGAILSSTIVGDTVVANGNYTYRTGSDPYSLGTGDGAITVNGQSRIYFNALREFSRSGMILADGRVILSFASHGDNGPYHGWLLSYDPSSLALNGALDTTPNGGLGGIWMGGGSPVVDSSGNIYAITGNGSFNTAASNFGANYAGLPKDADYGDAFIKISLDTTHNSATNQNVNGWGLQIVDFFSPYNNTNLNNGDTDLGSGGAMLLPDSAGSTAHPHLLIGAGKAGTIYLVDRDSMGGFNPNTDKVVQEAANTNTTGINGSLNTPAFFNGLLYIFPGYGGDGRAYTVTNGVIGAAYATHTSDTIGSLDGTPSISASGATNGIVWVLDRGSNELKAYRADNLAAQLWTSASAANNRDRIPGVVTKFSVPTIADGLAFVGSSDTVNGSGIGYLTTYGPPVPPTSGPAAPSNLSATSTIYNVVNLTWVDNASNEDLFQIERSSNAGATWTQIGTASSNATTYSDTTVLATTTYSYRVRAYNSFNNGTESAYSNTISVTTPQAPPTGTGDGAAAKYYNDTNGVHDQGTPALVRVDPQINFDFGAGSPGAPIGVDSFSVVWTGKVQPQFSEAYTFYTDSDDGVRLTVNGTMIINDYVDHGTTEDSATVQLSAGQKYTFEMDYFEDGGSAVAKLLWSSPSTGKQAIPQSQLYSGTAPAAPTNLAGHATSGTEIDLTWTDHASNEEGYSVERMDGPNGTFTAVAQLAPNTTSYNDTNLLPGTQYTYRVRATNFAANSGYSNSVVITAPTPPAKPSNAAVSNVTTTSLHLTWQDNSTNEDGFYIQRHIPGGQYLVIATVPPNTISYDDSGLTPGTEYDYHILAYNVAGNTDFTGVLTSTLSNAPTGLAATSADSSATLTWSAPSYQGDNSSLTFAVYRGTTSGGESTTPLATGLTSATYTDTGLTNGVTYYYTVVAMDPGGNSAFSNETFATPAAVAVAPTVQSFVVDNGTAQRSMVRKLTVTFSRAVTLSSGAFTLTLRGANGASTAVAFSSTTSDGGVTYVLTPTGASFGDGVYDVTVHAANVHDATTGQAMGADQAYSFFRLFGDSNGDGTVNATDYRAFTAAYLHSTGQPGFNSIFDVNNDGTINATDYRSFTANYLRTIGG